MNLLLPSPGSVLHHRRESNSFCVNLHNFNCNFKTFSHLLLLQKWTAIAEVLTLHWPIWTFLIWNPKRLQWRISKSTCWKKILVLNALFEIQSPHFWNIEQSIPLKFSSWLDELTSSNDPAKTKAQNLNS